MKNWKKVILGVALSFMVFFTAIGYAALTDTLSISGTLNASAPNDIFITDISHVSGLDLNASIVYPTNMSAIITGSSGDAAVYAITVRNNHPTATYIYTGTVVDSAYSSVPVTITTSTDDKNENQIPTDAGEGYVSGTPVEPGGTFTFYTTYTLTGNASGQSILVNYSFETVKYKIEYINKSIVHDTRYVYDNSVAVSTANTVAAGKVEAQMGEGYEIEYWMNIGSTPIGSLDAGYAEDVELYPSFRDIYTATFVEQDGTIITWATFTTTTYSNITDLAAGTTPTLTIADCYFDGEWEVREVEADGSVTKTLLADYDFKTATGNITIYPIYVYDGDVNLIPVDKDGNGETDEWQVGGFKGGIGLNIVKIPNSVNGLEVTSIADGALSAYDDIHAVLIPSNVTEIGSAAFADGKVIKEYPWGGTYETTGTETVTLYYQGDKTSWDAITKTGGWDANLGDGSRVFFLGEDGKVDPNLGYMEYDGSEWKYHQHAYTIAAMESCTHGAESHYEYSEGIFGYGAGLDEDKMTDYDGTCDCGCGTRPDAGYWTP